MSNPLLPGELQSRAQVRHRIDDSDLPVGQRPEIDWNAGAGITIGVAPSATRDSMVVSIDTTAGSGITGKIDVGAGQAIDVGYTLSATTFTAIDTNQDLVLPASIGDEFVFDFDGVVTTGTGSASFSVLSANSGTMIGEATAGWPGSKISASSTKVRCDWTGFYQITADDLVNGFVTFRPVYALSVGGGSPKLYANDTDGHWRLRAANAGSVSYVVGQNTGQPPVTPPTSGTFTPHTGVHRNGNNSTATEVTGSFTPVAGNEIYAFVFEHVEGVNAATVTMAMTDSFGDSGGSKTSWSQVLKNAQSAPNAANSNSVWVFRRTIGNTPSAGTVTATSNAGTFYREFFLTVVEGTTWTETPSQSGSNTAANVNVLNVSAGGFTAPGASSAVLACCANPCASLIPAAGATLPTNGGTWVSLDTAVTGGSGWSVGYIIGGAPTQAQFSGLTADTAINIAGFIVLDPSGTTTAAPGTDAFTHADQSPFTGTSTDLTWTIKTV